MLRARTLFYHQLRQMIAAGVDLPRSLETAGDRARPPYGRWAPQLAAGCAAGRALGEQLAEFGESPLVAALVTAGERSGQMPAMLEEIEQITEHTLATRSLIIGRSIYPLLLLHAALMLPGLVLWILGTGSVFNVVLGPLVVWAVLGGGWLALRGTRASGIGARIAMWGPLRALTVHRCTANTCLVLHATARAGMLWPDGLRLASEACGNRIWGEDLRRAAADIESERRPDLIGALARVPLPREVRSMLTSAETAGETETVLHRCAVLERERFHSRVTWTARVAMGLLYGLVMLFAAATIIGMYASYLQGAMSILEE